jgi:hypothetical protein
MNTADTIDGARRAFEIAGRGCIVRIGEDEPRYATVTIPNSAASASESTATTG